MASNLVKTARSAPKRNVRRGAPPVIKQRRARAQKVEATEPDLADGGEAASPFNETLAARAAEKRSRKKDDAGNFLSQYFREMAELEVLEPEQELESARDIEALDILVWERALGFAPLSAHLLGVVEQAMDGALKETRALRRAVKDARGSTSKATQTKLRKAARAAAEGLREADSDRLYLGAVLDEVDLIARGVTDPAGAKRPRVSTSSKAFRAYRRGVRQAVRASAEARNDFVRANLRLVVSIARRFNHGRMPLADLIQEGNIGLMKAVERYDYRRGFRFSTYASWWIRHAISRALADKGREVRLPVHMIDAQHRISKATRELTAKLGRQPTSQEIAQAANIAAGKIEKMRTYLVDQSFSLDRPVNDEDGRSLVEFLQDPSSEDSSPLDTMAAQALTQEMRLAMCELKPIEAEILRQRFGLENDQELTLKEIGQKYNLSRERIRQLQEQALTKMRRALQRREVL